MQASNKNQLTLHRKIIFREFSQISRSYYNDLSERIPRKNLQNFYNYLYTNKKLTKHIDQNNNNNNE